MSFVLNTFCYGQHLSAYKETTFRILFCTESDYCNGSSLEAAVYESRCPGPSYESFYSVVALLPPPPPVLPWASKCSSIWLEEAFGFGEHETRKLWPY